MNKYIGKKLDGRYEIQELIGIGGMADVYRALDVLENKIVAVKILKDEYLTNEDFKRRFRNESKAIAVLSHPNIVKVFDVSFGEKVQFIVMECVEGITLKEYIEQQSVVVWKEAVHFSVQVLRALQHAHDNGIVHRDVKPQNVMLLQDGTVKVMDFGIARFARDNGKTISDKAIGSVHYISPEQARGEVTDEKTDIYSVGVLLFEMLTGKVPFDGDTPIAIAVKQMQVEPQKPREINPDIPEGLEEIIIRAMKKDPDLRYQTAAEMLRDIDEFKRNPSVVFEYKYFTDNSSTKYFDKIGAKEGEIIIEKKKLSPTIQILFAVTVATVVLAFVAIFFFFSRLQTPTPEVPVPTVVGQLYDDVINSTEYEVEFVLVNEETSDEYEAGYIIEQEPMGGTSMKENQTVKLTVSTGINKAPVPDVTSMTREQATEALEKEGFEFEFVTEFSDQVDSGLVIRTNPPANQETNKGQKIRVYVSAGAVSMPVSVPSVVGMTKEEAIQTLTGLNLRNLVTELESYEPQGEVLFQSHNAGDKVNSGTLIEIQVSSGTPPESDLVVNIPLTGDLDNKTFTFNVFLDGEQINTMQINPTTTTALDVPISSSGQKTLIIQVDGQTFAQYSLDFQNSTIEQTGKTNMQLLEEQAETTVTLPNLIGMTKAEADAALKKLGLIASFEAVDSDKPKDEVVGQLPSANTKVDVGSTIAVRISLGDASTSDTSPETPDGETTP